MEAVLRERYLVKPTKPHSLSSFSHSLSLSPLDLKCIALPYTQRILFYPPPLSSSSSSSFLQIASHICESLADVLVLFRPFAGRLVCSASGEIECSDAGAEFVVAYVDQRMPEISELWKMDLPPDWLNIVAMPLHALDAADQPLLQIQVTKFQCGGFCIGCSFSHVVADGYSFWHFMKSWSEIARGGPISLTPLHNRELLKLINSSNQAAEGENTSQGGLGGQASWVPYKNAVFHLSKEAIAKLKQEVNEEGVTHNGSHFSSFESLCAFFWRAITRARLIPDDEETKFCTAVNCRRRLEPPLSDAYFGNAITNVYASAKAGDLARRELSYAARLVHKAISKCDKISISEMQIMPSSIWPPSVNDLFVGGSPRFPLYEIDFGWGKPVVVRRPQFFSQGVMIVDPGFQGEGSASVSIGLSSEALEILMRNEEIIQICRDPMSLT